MRINGEKQSRTIRNGFEIMKSLLKLSILPGLIGAISMVPYGMVLMFGLKLPVNIYGGYDLD